MGIWPENLPFRNRGRMGAKCRRRCGWTDTTLGLGLECPRRSPGDGLRPAAPSPARGARMPRSRVPWVLGSPTGPSWRLWVPRASVGMPVSSWRLRWKDVGVRPGPSSRRPEPPDLPSRASSTVLTRYKRRYKDQVRAISKLLFSLASRGQEAQSFPGHQDTGRRRPPVSFPPLRMFGLPRRSGGLAGRRGWPQGLTTHFLVPALLSVNVAG